MATFTRKRIFGAATAALLGMAMAAGPTVAADGGGSQSVPPDTGTLQALEKALVKLQLGRATPSDRSLIEQYPHLTDDLEPVYTFGSSSEEAPAPKARAGADALVAATSCRIYTGWVNANSVISGSRLYTWHQRLYVCASNGRMTQVVERYHYVTNRDWAWHDCGLVSESLGALGNWSIPSYMRGEMEMCVASFCTNWKYPWVKIVANANNTANITAGHA